MLTKSFFFLNKDPGVSKLSSFSLVLFFILLSDAVLSFWVPNFLQGSLGSAFLMGIVVSFSSIVGFTADLVFPQLLKNYSVRKLILSAILLGVLFIASLFWGTTIPHVLIFLIAMAVWGIYYEFLGFGVQQFIADTMSLKMRVEGWAIVGIFKSLAYFLGPIFAGWLIMRGEYILLFVCLTFVLFGYLTYTSISKTHDRKVSIEANNVNLWREISHWKELFPRIWPILTISLLMGTIDASFWTVGAVWTEKLSQIHPFGFFVLPAYELPFLFIPLMFTRLNIFEGKKALSEKLILTSGLLLILLIIKTGVITKILIVFLSSIFLAGAKPLVDAVYTDIVARMGVERKHLVGLSSSTVSLAYIVSPALAGFLASRFGETATFVIIGVLAINVSLLLLIFTPKKLRLPETEIQKWED